MKIEAFQTTAWIIACTVLQHCRGSFGQNFWHLYMSVGRRHYPMSKHRVEQDMSVRRELLKPGVVRCIPWCSTLFHALLRMKYSEEYFSFSQQDSLVLDYKPHAKFFVACIWKKSLPGWSLHMHSYYPNTLFVINN